MATSCRVCCFTRWRVPRSSLKRRDWPFAGHIGIRERDWRGVEEIHVFDRWCYQGSVHGGAALAEFERRPAGFDQDIYRILLRALERPAPGLQIVELERR